MVETFVTREEVVQYARGHEPEIKQRLLEKFAEWLKTPFPERGYEKYLNAGKVYGVFEINQDWGAELENEMIDAFLYEATDEVKTLRV